MKRILLSLIIACSLLFTGCATTNVSTKDRIERVIPYIKPAVSLATIIAIEESVKPEERKDIARQINGVSTVIESLAAGVTPTPEDLEKVLLLYFPHEAKYSKYVISLKSAYTVAFLKLDGNAALVAKILKEISTGAKEASAAYLVE